VYVVDNNSTEDVKSIVEQFDFCRYLHESKPGAYHSRNCAIAALNDEEYVGFTDADCIPEPDWIEQAVTLLKRKAHGAIGGRVAVFSEALDKPNTIELYEILFAFPQQVYVNQDKFAVTANMFTTKSVLDEVGGFNAGLFSGGDAEWGQRLHAAGYTMDYAETVCVNHPARDHIDKILSKVKRTVGGCYQQRKTNPVMHRSFTLLSIVKGFLPPARAISRLFNSEKPITVWQKARLAGLLFYFKYHTNVMKVAYKLKLIRDFERF
jgi:glycosyltransferase involved in cell wall biosynthesis